MVSGTLLVGGASSALRLVEPTAASREELVLDGMVTGWSLTQCAAGIGQATIDARVRTVKALIGDCGRYPWQWSPMDADAYFARLRRAEKAGSTLRGYQSHLSLFCQYAGDPAYPWRAMCEAEFGSAPVQVVNSWNKITHTGGSEREPKRAFTKAELQEVFACADAHVARARRLGRKGWVSAFRDAAALKLAYAYGLRCTETRMLDVADFYPNPHAPAMGQVGVCRARFGKPERAGIYKPRTVVAVFDWTLPTWQEWVHEIRPYLAKGLPRAIADTMWPTERRTRIGRTTLIKRMGRIRREIGLPSSLDFHSLRRAYATHLTEDGIEHLFIQTQVGHKHASTTSDYIFVSGDYTSRQAGAYLQRVAGAATGAAPR